jgi:SAM-dependent methyltransferase
MAMTNGPAPDSCAGEAELKDSIRAWWASTPMTYGVTHGETSYLRPDGSTETVAIGSERFFELADETFYAWNPSLHTDKARFGTIYDYDRYRGKRVLEIGCGMGCMAMNWARQGALLSAVDLNPVAVAQTKRRFELYGLSGDIRQADGEALPFDNDTFDFGYSWGVLHHTPGIRKAIGELFRVVKPGASVGLMLYSRTSLYYRYFVEYMEGLMHLEHLFLDDVELGSRYGDGERQEGNPHTWPVTPREVVRDLFPQYTDVRIRTLGTDVPSVLHSWHPMLRRLPLPWVKALARRWGWSLWITARKPDWLTR